MKRKELPLFHNVSAKQVLAAACKANGVTLELLRELVEVQRGFAGSARQNGITNALETCLTNFIDHERED
ncbi:MAG: hypothetical protein JNK05_13390 [Myxococcales bacterium]|nr:hypothetical protein [Myxococcales bacterium]